MMMTLKPPVLCLLQRIRLPSCAIFRYLTGTKISSSYVEAKNSHDNSKFVLTKEDERLALFGDFIGVEPSPLTQSLKKQKNPFTVIAKLQDDALVNFRLKAYEFISSVLLPLEQKAEPFCSILKQSSHFYMPAIINMCGEVMSDVPMENRMIIVNRVLKAMKNCGIKFCMKSINATVAVWNQNHHTFDPTNLLHIIETQLNLTSNEEFFSLCAWQLARQGDAKKLFSWEDICRGRGLQPSTDMVLASIFCAENVGDIELSNQLIDRFTKEHGGSADDLHSDARRTAYAVAAQGAAWSNHMDRINYIFSQFTIEKQKMYSTPMVGLPEENTRVLNLSADMILNTLWILNIRHSKDHGLEFSHFTEKVIDKLLRTGGFFKRLVAHTERHIIHHLYHTAIVILADFNRIRQYLSRQSRDMSFRQMLGKLANQMIRNDWPIERIKEISQKVSEMPLKAELFYDNLMYSILMHRHSSHEKTLQRFFAFLDIHDPQRERFHLILPLLVRANSLQSRCKLLYICSSMGYKDFSTLDPHVMYRHLYLPILTDKSLNARTFNNNENIWSSIDFLANYLTTFGISKAEVWQMMYALLKDFTHDPYYNDDNLKSVESWLRANVKYLEEEKSSTTNPLNERATIADILEALRVEFHRKSDLPSLCNAAYELRRRFPEITAPHSFQFEAYRSTIRLFDSIITEHVLFDTTHVENIMNFYTSLIKLEFMRIHRFEMITSHILFKILHTLNWDEAINAWLRFQSTFHCPNGIVELLSYALVRPMKEDVREARVNFVIHKAYNFLPPERVKAIYASALISCDDVNGSDKAVKLLSSCDPNKLPKLNDYEFAFLLTITRALKIGLERTMLFYPIHFLRTVLPFTKDETNLDKHRIASTIISFCLKHNFSLSAINICRILSDNGIRVKPLLFAETRRSLMNFKTFSRYWVMNSNTTLLNYKNARNVLHPKMKEINNNLINIVSKDYRKK